MLFTKSISGQFWMIMVYHDSGGILGTMNIIPACRFDKTEKASWFVCFITFANGHVCVIVCKFAEKYIRSNPHRSSGRLSKFVGPSEKWGRPKRNVRMQAGGRRQFSSSWKSGGGWNFVEWGFHRWLVDHWILWRALNSLRCDWLDPNNIGSSLLFGSVQGIQCLKWGGWQTLQKCAFRWSM